MNNLLCCLKQAFALSLIKLRKDAYTHKVLAASTLGFWVIILLMGFYIPSIGSPQSVQTWIGTDNLYSLSLIFTLLWISLFSSLAFTELREPSFLNHRTLPVHSVVHLIASLVTSLVIPIIIVTALLIVVGVVVIPVLNASGLFSVSAPSVDILRIDYWKDLFVYGATVNAFFLLGGVYYRRLPFIKTLSFLVLYLMGLFSLVLLITSWKGKLLSDLFVKLIEMQNLEAIQQLSQQNLPLFNGLLLPLIPLVIYLVVFMKLKERSFYNS